MILEEETFKKFGYLPLELTPQSKKRILVKCEKCGIIREIRNDAYRELCLSCASKGKKYSEETRKKMSDAHKGKNHSMYGKHHSEETKKKISEARKGKHLSDETKQKMSKAQRGKISKRKGKKLSEETKQKISNTLKGRKRTEESKRKQRNSQIEYMMNNPPKFQSSWEKAYEKKILSMLKIGYKSQFGIKGIRHPFDFAIPEWKLLIEIDSNYWHSSEKAKKRDKEINEFVEQSEWSLLRISEDKLKESNII